ncbi:ABC transporter ATP-binding protein [Desulfoluna limicola]|uniref:ABC transporter ATP-binding protein n=1 Tax=Desulfoluna limicola TaxID=2810562 RepID=A0ABM7PBR4_9BACT|nr:ABC transporter ATP-binding protein [Desulfoluna limicola]BCS95126.1 ABC transporter ATP-binding protein [Desulfoluna limicola]
MIEYRNVRKEYGNGKEAVTAVRDISLQIKPGEVVVFLGPSGCGKTTMLRMTNKLEDISGGDILVDGKSIRELNPVQLRRSMGYVIQQIGLFPNKTIYENIAMIPRVLKWDKATIDERVDHLLKLVKLDPETYSSRYPAELSGGQQQRIGVARALAADPDILLMDEPFGAIDPINRDQIQDEFMRLQARLKKTIVFVSHDIHEAIKMADRIAIFKDGKIVQFDTPEMILTQPKNKFVSDFVGADRALKVLGLIRARDAMNTSPKNVIPAEMKSPQALEFMVENSKKTCIVVENGKPVGYVTPKLLKFEQGPVTDVAEPFQIFVEDDEPLREVLSSMLMDSMAFYCVVDDNGDFKGTITYLNIQNKILEFYDDDNNE